MDLKKAKVITTEQVKQVAKAGEQCDCACGDNKDNKKVKETYFGQNCACEIFQDCACQATNDCACQAFSDCACATAY